MGFKVNTSFVRFLTMGAVGTHATMDHLRELGFKPIELERYSTSNKIWTTKVKRLRLPDVLCVRTGLRFEVRAKSDLKIRMSDAPNNPERRWDSGLRDDDLVALVACSSGDDPIEALGPPVYLKIAELRKFVGKSKLGPPKSASEGAEQDREWKSTVPRQDGEVTEVTDEKIVTKLASGRKQSYRLKGKTAQDDKKPHVDPGDRFTAGASIISSVVPRLVKASQIEMKSWSPVDLLSAAEPVDRYAAAKAIPYSDGATSEGLEALLGSLENETDERVKLEMAGSAARMGERQGLDYLVQAVTGHDRADLRMEAVLILSELGTSAAGEELQRIAGDPKLTDGELRQAAAWGLGKAGCRMYQHLVDLLDDEDDAVVMHAIVAFGTDTPTEVLTKLVRLLVNGSHRERAAASEALRLIGSEAVVTELVNATSISAKLHPWVIATLGRLDAPKVRKAIQGTELANVVEPILCIGPAENWLASSSTSEDLRSLLMQNVSAHS